MAWEFCGDSTGEDGRPAPCSEGGDCGDFGETGELGDKGWRDCACLRVVAGAVECVLGFLGILTCFESVEGGFE